jgi:hypothetical protein
MLRMTMISSMIAAGLFAPAPHQASGEPVETAHLVVSDGTGKLTAEQLKSMAGQTQETLDRILAFWTAEPGIKRFGKIRVVFDLPRKDVYSCVFYWDDRGDQRTRVVQVFGTDRAPQMLAHKLTSAVFPQKDKLIRNLMGILTEAQVGNPLTFPVCGFGSDEWVLALLREKAYLPLNELGPDHESWGMRDAGGGKLSVFDKAKQHKAYAEMGSFANYLLKTYGVLKIKQLQRLSQEKDRPFQDVFGASLQELEADMLKQLRANGKATEKNVLLLLQLLQKNPETACSSAQKVARGKK